MYTIDRALLTADTDLVAVAVRFLQRHQAANARLDRLDAYYRGDHDIKHRVKRQGLANLQVVCNHAKYITDMAIGYLVGDPVSYEGEGIDGLLAALDAADAPTQDMDLAKDASVFGRAVELVYPSDDAHPVPRLAALDPRQAFVVYDDTVQHRPAFGVHFYRHTLLDGSDDGYHVSIYTDQQRLDYLATDGFTPRGEIARRQHPFGYPPLVEYDNNEEQQGDYEQVIDLIDVYNILQSDRVNDKEQFVDAILVLINSRLGDDASETREALQRLRMDKLLELPDDAKAEWLTRQLSEADVELLRKSLEEDIHKYAMVPCVSDESFAGNASGVAMRYKLLGFEQLAKIKERYFKEGLRQRLRLMANMLAAQGAPAMDIQAVRIAMNRSLPINELEIAQIVQMLQGAAPQRQLLALLPFIDNVDDALAELEQEKAANIERQRQTFGLDALPQQVSDDGGGQE